MSIQLEKSWLNLLEGEFSKQYMYDLKSFLLLEQKQHLTFPPNKLIFNAFSLTPFEEVKVVILGQDPYHEVNQAHGLAFSVPESVFLPPSLQNIYKEIENDLGITKNYHNGNLSNWAKQGVFLLNTCLTVREHIANSHSGKGWENFTDCVIKTLSDNKEGIVFILWGSNARNKKSLINNNKHLILEAVHPSPLSANRGGFFGCKHFSKCNDYLISKGKNPIEW
ncbi:uracil-DNA glycosylase 2 [Bacteroidia bacterium]|nr:uracil-DNA glycosylase 2 [Bacteroidia bacterium]